MHILGTLLIGFLVGLVARFFMPGKQGLGIIMTTVLGIVGAVVGTYIGQALGWYAEGEPAGFFASVFGAMVILLLARLLARN
ncbi:GlsB/YeaQ/YmgE family stress response membrane protein [Bdellovibrio sp. SKB1291214]|uniref:GlsB/YeaQ/YmgE family stress response membrane protein n=1 Tax=Bdellovibrio sp. SKB1291214 TaxID=1732569 RepID=UPI000B5171CE|nr:GlsB/YeaQ/YmgE family stress response membrane protein [Bdellovibrio sp. SKB1291214]UYL08005.1 GlsB/YeaQ/YmgE family stress response membrane protein [Bdellovibrio sp. SKB1291214]